MKLFRLLLALCLVAGFSSSGARAADSGDWNRVIAAARKEGAVTMYANAGNDEQLRAAAESFEKTYGVHVTLSYANGPLNLQKILAETQTGHVQCDVFYSGLSDIDILNKQGYVVSLNPPNQANIFTELRVLGVATPLFVNVYGILVNTQALGRVPLPTSWHGLLNPGLANKMVMQDPRVDGGGISLFIGTYDKVGPAFQKALAAQHPTINGAGSGIAAEESVARGDYAVLVGGRPRALAAYPQSPLKWISPSEGAVVVPIAMTQIKAAPHPNAARLWANYLLQPNIQSSLSENVLPVVKKVHIVNPALQQKIKFLEVFDPSQDRTKYYADAKQLYGAQ